VTLQPAHNTTISAAAPRRRAFQRVWCRCCVSRVTVGSCGRGSLDAINDPLAVALGLYIHARGLLCGRQGRYDETS